MRWKSMLVTIVINIFLMLMVSLLMEYSNLTERFASLESTVQEALDLAIDSSVQSEEFFTDEYNKKLVSYAANDGLYTTDISTLIWAEGDKKFYFVNTYALAMFYKTYGKLPEDAYDVTQANNKVSGVNSVKTVYEFLYGGTGSDYNHSSLSWANKNSQRKREYSSESWFSSNNRNVAVADFKNFYNGIGKYQKSAGFLKYKISSKAYGLEAKTYPVLYNMGLSWMGGYTETGSEYTNDNFTSSGHVGKKRLGQKNSLYYLTPKSLGVTYVPVDVLKPSFIANLDTIVRLNKLGGNTQHITADAADVLQSASTCIATDVYTITSKKTGTVEDGAANYVSNSDTNNELHKPSSIYEDIVTDGLVEYDLSTVKVKVDYFYVDYAAVSDAEVIISKVNGAVQNFSNSLNEDDSRRETLNKFLTLDSGNRVASVEAGDFASEYDSVKDGRIVARVSAKILVHVPYQSAILQHFCKMTGTRHYDIKLFNPYANKAISGSDGIWYQYTTYYSTSRS